MIGYPLNFAFAYAYLFCRVAIFLRKPSTAPKPTKPIARRPSPDPPSGVTAVVTTVRLYVKSWPVPSITILASECFRTNGSPTNGSLLMICVVPLPINVRLSSSNVTDFKLKSVPVALPSAVRMRQTGATTPGTTSRRVTDEPLPVHRIGRSKLACKPTMGIKSPVALVTDNGPCGKFWPLNSSSLIPLLLIPLLLIPLLSVMVPLPVNAICPLTLPSTTIASTCCGAINATVANTTRTDHRNFDIFIVSSLHSFCVNCSILRTNRALDHKPLMDKWLDDKDFLCKIIFLGTRVIIA